MVVARDNDPGGSDKHGASLELGVEWLVRSPALEMVEHVLVARMKVVDDDQCVAFRIVAVPPLVSVLDVELPLVVYEGPGSVALACPWRPPEPEVLVVELAVKLLDVLR